MIEIEIEIENKNIRCNGGGCEFLHIADELVWEILSHLPIIDLHRAKCVCKTWRSIITSPQFIKTHPRRLGLLVSTVSTKTRELKFYYAGLHDNNDHSPPPKFVCRFRFPTYHYSRATQVVNGLVCLYSYHRTSLLNLCTGEILDLPQPGFRPYSYSHYYLGFDTSNKVYKLLRLVKNCGPNYNNRAEADILTITTSVSSCKWRKLDQLDNDNIDVDYFMTPSSFCVNGTLYWLFKSMHSDGVLAFNLDSETFGVAAYLPPRHDSSWQVFETGKLLHSKRGLGLVGFSDLRSRKKLAHFSLGFEPEPEPERVWVKNMIELPDELCGDWSRDVIPVGSLPNGDMLLANNKVSDCFTPVYSYNWESKSFERFVVGKLHCSVASMSLMERASSITCLQEDPTPLKDLLLGNGSAA